MFNMSSVYLFRGKSKSAIEVNFKCGIYLNLDVINELDLQISPILPSDRNEVSTAIEFAQILSLCLTHSSTYCLTHALIQSLTHSLTVSLTHSLSVGPPHYL